MADYLEAPVGSIFEEEDIAELARVLTSGVILSRGPDIDYFESEFAAFCGVNYAVAVSSCTAALRLSTQLLRLSKNDEVIVPANAFWNTIVALVERDVTLKIADIEPDTLNIDPASVESLITDRTKAVYVYDHGGNICDYDRLIPLCKKHGITLIEDAAHAVGGRHRDRPVGGLADITCFSFSTLKNLVTLGEGGMLTTNNPQFAAEAAKLRQSFPIGICEPVKLKFHGQYSMSDPFFMKPGDSYGVEWKELLAVGTNLKMTTPQAAVGRVQLKKLPRMNSIRASIGKRYINYVASRPELKTLRMLPHAESSWHFYSFFVKPESGLDRNRLMLLLNDKYGIKLLNRYWPIHLNSLMRFRGFNEGDAPVCERVWFEEQVSLPIAPSMTEASTTYLLESIDKVIQELCG